MTDVLDDSQESVAGLLAELIAYDAARNAGLVETLRAWFDLFGDLARAVDSIRIRRTPSATGAG